MSRAAHLMALWPRHRRTFFCRADFRGPAAPDGPPPCQRPCGYQCMHACIDCKSCRLQLCEELVAICSRLPQARRYLIGVAGQRGAPAPLRAALLSRRHIGQQLHVHLGSRSTCSVQSQRASTIEGKHGIAADDKQVVRTSGRFRWRHLNCIPNAADVAADHTLRLAGRRDVPWLLLSAVLPGDLSHQCHFQSPLPQRSRKNCCTCR